MYENIQEFTNTARRDIRIDPEAGILYGVKIIGCKSRNNREYPNETLQEAISLYENAKVNLDHPEGDPGKPRSYQDRFGTIRNVRLKENEGLFADFRFNPKHIVAEQLLWDAKNAPENVGFSHNVEGIIRREKDRMIVEKILRVRSVDLVADPATTSGLFESVEENIKTSALPESLKQSVDPQTNNSKEQDKFPIENNSVESENNFVLLVYETLLKRLAETVPASKTLLDSNFLETLRLTKDLDLCRRLIDERIRLVESIQSKTITESKPVSREQFVPQKPIDMKSFVKLLRK